MKRDAVIELGLKVLRLIRVDMHIVMLVTNKAVLWITINGARSYTLLIVNPTKHLLQQAHSISYIVIVMI